LNTEEWFRIIDNIIGSVQVERFNIAGGEPLIYRGLGAIIEYANKKGIPVSIISNGSLLTEKRLNGFRNGVSIIGLSIDSLCKSTLQTIGRCDTRGRCLPLEKYLYLCDSIKNFGFKLKINTVVSKLNINEKFTWFINRTLPDRWKLLKMQVFKNEQFCNADNAITDCEFEKFVAFHNIGAIKPVVENSLKNSYIMVDPCGFLIDNTGENYIKAGNLLQEDFALAFSRIAFDEVLYKERYLA
jgi:radical S-adenosyl methionine domain-containing protein 2